MSKEVLKTVYIFNTELLFMLPNHSCLKLSTFYILNWLLKLKKITIKMFGISYTFPNPKLFNICLAFETQFLKHLLQSFKQGDMRIGEVTAFK